MQLAYFYLFIIFFFLRDFIFKKTSFEKLQYWLVPGMLIMTAVILVYTHGLLYYTKKLYIIIIF